MALESEGTTDRFRPEQGAVFDLSSRTKLRITGADRLRYLNGQISNDLRKVTETNAIHACVLSAKGKINADVFIHAKGDSFLVDSDPDVREQLVARLERYVIADDVVIEDVTERFGLFHVLRNAPAGVGRQVSANRYRDGGVDVWIDANDADVVRQKLQSIVPFCDAEC